MVEKLVSKGLVTTEQNEEIKHYTKLGIFSINGELLFLLYLSVLLFAAGIGIIIYKNIESIGHLVIITATFLLMLGCFYFCFKKAKGFSKAEIFFENPIYDYLVLLCGILTCIFIGYLQYQYVIFGNDFGLVSLFSAVFCFGLAYYFDNKSVLSIAITALAAFVGITITPQTLLQNEIYSNPQLSYFGLSLGVFMLLWTEYSLKKNLKNHFQIVYLTFALNVVGVCCIAGLFESFWLVFTPIMTVLIYYFYQTSYKILSTFIFVLTLIYGYIGCNIFFVKCFQFLDFEKIADFIVIALPIYIIGSIILFIQLVKKFNKEKHASLQ